MGGRWDEIEGLAKPGVKLEDNLVGEDPKFVDAAKGDFRLQPNSPALVLGFQQIPVAQIGLYQDPLRVTWPVVTEVRYRSSSACGEAKRSRIASSGVP